ncbi:MAG TPA: transglycosylase SLT domain-containing protein [Thermoanaerobaculia bacterium]|nr:transglycosylase SLT domain-containing protein [Thermoanaerobaculia bacterium]
MGQGRVVAVGLLGWLVLACSSSPPRPAAPAPAPVVVEEPPKPLDRRELAKNALALFDAKRYDEAIAALGEAADAYPEVAPFLRLRIVEAEAARGNPRNAANAAMQIIALSDTSAATVARLRLPAILAIERRADVPSATEGRTRRPPSTTDAAWEEAMRVPIDELTEEDFVALATALASANRTDLATRTRMRLLNDYTQGRYTEQTYGHLRGVIETLSTDEQLALAGKLARADRYDQALEILDRLGNAEQARATRMRALFNSRHYTTLLEETKDAKLTDPALLLLRARAAWRDDQPEMFLAGLAQVEKEFPSSREAIEAKVLRAKYHVTDATDYAIAIGNLTKAIDAGAHGSDGENLWSLGYTYVLAGKDNEALRVFDRYIAAYPDGDWKTNSLFWSAKIHDRHGRTAERDAKAQQIVDEYPFSYYAYRAKELWPLTPTPLPASGERVAGGRVRGVFPTLTVPDDPRFAVVRELLAISLPRDATREMKAVASKYPDNPAVHFMLADVYVQGGEPFKANGILQRRFRTFVRHGGANIPRRFWEILFPLAYWETIRTEAAKRALDPYLVASIIRQESGFEPATVSNAGAVGLMQIMPEEAPRIAGAAGLGEITRDSLFDPATNIAVGAAEYSQKLATMNGNHTLAIAAYNAGEEPVRVWLAHTPLDDIDRFIESIPFAETRLYVKTVNRNRHEYRRIYGE